MKPEAAQYVTNQLSRAEDRLRPYVRSGTWVYPKRPVFYRIDKYIRDFVEGDREARWAIIPGLRGVGKTTVVAQTYFRFKRNAGFKEGHILYISVDDIITAGLTLKEVLDAYESVIGIRFESVANPVLLLIDEVQQDPKWAAVLKSMYDKARNVFVVCTGSSAVQLQTNPDVARRGIFEKLYPLSFGEYEMLQHNRFPSAGLKQNIKDALYDSASAEEAYTRLVALTPAAVQQWNKYNEKDINDFLGTGTLPFTLRAPTLNIYDRISLLIDRMINKDIQELGKFDAQTLGVIKRLLFILADSNDGFSLNKVSGLLGIDRNTLTMIMDALEKAEVVIRIPPYGSNTSAVKKPSKYLFMSPAIRMSLLSITGLDETFLTRRGKLLEDVSGLHFYREFVSTGAGIVTYDSASGGADFILQISNKKQIAIEIGAGVKEWAQVAQTMAKVRCDYGLLVCKCDTPALSEDRTMVRVPLKYFLLA